jgi:hypothetical protein
LQGADSPNIGIARHFTGGDLFSKIAPAAAQFIDRYQPGP